MTPIAPRTTTPRIVADPATVAEVSIAFSELIAHDFARRHLIVPDRRDARDVLLVGPTTDPAAAFNVCVRLGVALPLVVGDSEEIAIAVDRLYERERATGSSREPSREDAAGDETDRVPSVDRMLAAADLDLLSTQGKGRVVRLVDALLFEALSRAASDVHIQPLADRTVVRYRIDGVLHDIRDIAPSVATAVVSRVKVMGRMDIAERRIPQDGRATVTIGRRPIDLRISTVPTSHGERAVLRLLDTSQQLCNFASLGMPDAVAAPFLDRASRTSGILLVTGPTGSGKTTTLYSTLKRIGSNDLNIMTIEDPIEYELSGGGLAISQAQVNDKKGITFEKGLRHILRQDPDVIMIGEIRDRDTARIAIQSSLTGHLVFSTLHTNDAPSALTRLVDLGIEPYLVAASLSAVLAQRLVRATHAACEGKGCGDCFGSGLLGRTGVFELLLVDERMRSIISSTPTLESVREAAIAGGMRTLLAEGERLVAEGKTTRNELRRVLHGLA